MPSSMLKLSRLQLFHLGQVRDQLILKDSKQHAQAQQTATFYLGQVRDQPILKDSKQHAQAQQTAT
jgi:hypothetical protein